MFFLSTTRERFLLIWITILFTKLYFFDVNLLMINDRLPMQIVGLNREIREVNTNESDTTKRTEGTENSGGRLLFPGERKQTDKGATIVRDSADRPQPFPYFP